MVEELSLGILGQCDPMNTVDETLPTDPRDPRRDEFTLLLNGLKKLADEYMNDFFLDGPKPLEAIKAKKAEIKKEFHEAYNFWCEREVEGGPRRILQGWRCGLKTGYPYWCPHGTTCLICTTSD